MAEREATVSAGAVAWVVLVSIISRTALMAGSYAVG
jgi:hypothetical protein